MLFLQLSDQKYNPCNEADAEILLQIFNELSDIDLSNDESGEDEVEIDQSPQQIFRVGADKIPSNKASNSEVFSSDMAWDDEDDLPLSCFVPIPSNFEEFEIITPKESIKWRRREFSAPNIFWNETQTITDDEILSPLKYFLRYIGDSEFEKIANFTNIYALQKDTNFKLTHSSEIKSLFGLHIAIGTLKYPKVRLFWEKSLGITLFQDAMTRDRFFQLRTHLHCVNNLEIPVQCDDKLYKVRPLYNAIRKRCLELDLEENLCIDEQIVPFRGHLAIKQYIKGKPCPWGVKIFVLCGKSGMAYDFLIYQGASTGLDKNKLKIFGLGGSVVLQLSERLQKEGHKLYFDNYFSNYQILQILKSKKIFAGGTVRINRFNNPPLLNDKELKRKGRGAHDTIGSTDGDVVLTKWMDNRSVVLASNFVAVGNEDTVSRWDKNNKTYVDVKRPEIVRLYNHSMGGVDLLDQMIGLYRIYIRSRKWTLRLIFHAVDLAIANSWFEYRKDCTKQQIPAKSQMSLLDFRLNLAECLVKVGKPVTTIRRGRPSSSVGSPIQVRVLKRHEENRPSVDIRHDGMDHMPHLDGKSEGKRCKNRKCNKKTHFLCDKCKVHLCLTKNRNCFVAYHRSN